DARARPRLGPFGRRNRRCGLGPRSRWRAQIDADRDDQTQSQSEQHPDPAGRGFFVARVAIASCHQWALILAYASAKCRAALDLDRIDVDAPARATRYA